jgi:hypothetical protein
MIKTKYVHVRDNNEPAPDSICYDLMQGIEDSVVRAEDAELLRDNLEGQEQVSTCLTPIVIWELMS